MASATKPIKLFVVFAAFLLTAFYLLPGPHRGTKTGLVPFPGEDDRKHGTPGSQKPLNPPPKVDLINGIPAIGFGTWRAPQTEACSPLL